jgi:large subunit ribosomal protein L30
MASKKVVEKISEIKVTLVRSTIGCIESQKATVAALGLKKIRQSKIHKETPAILGMVAKVAHLVNVEKI